MVGDAQMDSVKCTDNGSLQSNYGEQVTGNSKFDVTPTFSNAILMGRWAAVQDGIVGVGGTGRE